MGPPVWDVREGHHWQREEQVSPAADVSGRKEKHFLSPSTKSLSHPCLYPPSDEQAHGKHVSSQCDFLLALKKFLIS